MTPPAPSSNRHLLTPPFGFDRTGCGHAAIFYLEEDFLTRILCRLIACSLQAGESSVVLATEVHHRALARRLTSCGFDLPALTDAGRYAELNGQEILSDCMPGGKLDLRRLNLLVSGAMVEARAASHSWASRTSADATAESSTQPRTMVFGELVALLWARRDFAGVLAVEDFWDRLTQHFSFSLLCGYSITEFTEPGTVDAYLRICAAHSTVIPPDAFPTPQSEWRIMNATARSYREARSESPQS
jgi:hypothetical protein